MNNLEDGTALLPRWKIEQLMEERLTELYKEQVLPLHRDTSGRLDNVFTIINKIDGAVTAAKWIGGAFGFILVVLNIIVAVAVLKSKL